MFLCQRREKFYDWTYRADCGDSCFHVASDRNRRFRANTDTSNPAIPDTSGCKLLQHPYPPSPKVPRVGPPVSQHENGPEPRSPGGPVRERKCHWGGVHNYQHSTIFRFVHLRTSATLHHGG